MKAFSTETLMTAALQGNLAQVRACIAARVNLSTKSLNSVTQAARGWWGGADKTLRTRLAIISELVAAGCPVQGEALFTPIDRSEVEIVRFLVEHGAEVNVVQKGLTPLGVAVKEADRDISMIAVKHGIKSEADVEAEGAPKLEIIRLLIKAGANVNQVSGQKLGFGLTMEMPPLHQAVSNNHPGVIRLLHEAGADLNARDKNKNTAVLAAVNHGHLEAVKALVAAGANLSKAGEDGWTPLALAKDKKGKPYPEIVQVLESASAHVPRGFQLKEDFIKAAASGDVEQVKQFIARGAPLDARCNFDYRNATALALAAEAGHLKVVDALLAAGATVDAEDSSGLTSLFYAAKAGRAEAVRKLLKARARIEAMVKEPYEGTITPLVMAAEEGHLEVVRELLKGGANVAHRGHSGKTALTAAAQNRHTEVVRALVDALKKTGRNLRLLDAALWWATAFGNAATVKLLLAAGGNPRVAGRYADQLIRAMPLAQRKRSKGKLRLLQAAVKAQRREG